MKKFLITCLLICAALPVKAQNAPLVIEVFTHPGCAPLVIDDYNADGSLKNPQDVDKKFNRRHVTSVFEDLIKEHPDAIALHYFNDLGNHGHDEHGNDIPMKTVGEELGEFFNNRSYTYYGHDNFLNKHGNIQMIINSDFKTDGTMKHVVDLAIEQSTAEQHIKPLIISKDANALQVEWPEIVLEEPITPLLIGYKKTQNNEENRAPIALNPVNIVTDFKKLKSWNGDAKTQSVSIEDMDADAFAIIAQSERRYNARPLIYAAGKIE